ncbi:MAG TPA: ABC transporter substrate-binding protein [Xanthobacteraceae bacterium]|nr:ABC transporter substrate-binding protein [Xanthobacteraceae bacterium]
MVKLTRRQVCAGISTAAGVAASIGPARAEPLTIRLGYSLAAEEQLWLLMADHSLAKNYGTLYTLDATRFTSSSQRAQAFAAGAIDLASSGSEGVLFAAAEGIPSTIIASLSKESLHRGFNTTFLALDSSPINKVEDLKGKTVAVNGLSTTGELWLKTALERHGLSESDITVVPISFPAMAESLRSGRIDVGEFPQPFDAMARKEMKVKTIFTSKEGMPFDEELIVIVGHEPYLQAHAEAIRGFLADLQAATKFYLANPQKARQILIDKKFVRVPPDVYLNMKDYYRDPSLRVDLQSLKKMQDAQIAAGFQKKKVDVATIVDMSYLPK